MNAGLTLIGAGDWNDGMSAVGLEMKGESFWFAEFFYLILVRFSVLCKEVGKWNFTKIFQKSHKLKEAFNLHSWDGEWFFSATKDSGEKIGSSACMDGKIYLKSTNLVCN